VAARLHRRGQAQWIAREYFAEQRFLEVETPMRVPAPGVDWHLDATAAEGGFLITSPELAMKRLLVGGLPRVYQFARVSRRGEKGCLHEPEFSLLEWYRAFDTVEAVMVDTEQLVARVAGELSGGVLRGPGGKQAHATLPFDRISVREAFARYAGVEDMVELAQRDETRFFELLTERVEPALAEYERPVFLYEYPISQASLARPSPEDPNVAERFELYCAGVELCNGFGELTDAAEQRRRFEAEAARRAAEGRIVYPLDERFLDALCEGMPPAGGNALGFDRLLLLVTGANTLADVIAFASDRL
jgi:lysyl-tRNA synthetase class 2